MEDQPPFEVKQESLAEEPTITTDYWYGLVVDGQKERREELSEKMLESMKAEKTNMVSAIMERQCFLKCAHCLYQKDTGTSKEFSKDANLTEVIANIVRQLPNEQQDLLHRKPMFLHEGRTIRKWHLDIFDEIRKQRPDVSIGLIDNGTYVKYIPDFNEKGLRLDWLDVSIDGTESSHNLQRDPEMKKAYEIAMEGLRHARDVVKSNESGGKVSSLMTLTKLNFADIFEAADLLFKPNPDKSALDMKTGEQLNYIDEFHITTMSPELPENFPIEISVEDMKVAWEQIKKLYASRADKGESPVFFKIYRHQDLEKLAQAVGEKKFWTAITDETEGSDEAVDRNVGYIKFYIDHVPVAYYPISTFPIETVLIDADGSYRSAYSQQYSLEELRSGKSKGGDDLTKYTWEKLTPNSSYPDAFKSGVENWWKGFGNQILDEEISTMERIKEKANK